MSSAVWIPYLLALITGNKWLWGVGTTVWLFWLGPGTPYIPFTIAITLALKKLLKRGKL